MTRRHQSQLWVDMDFMKKLNEIKAKKMLKGDKINSLGDLTKEIINCPSFKQVEDDMLNKSFERRLKFDQLLR